MKRKVWLTIILFCTLGLAVQGETTNTIDSDADTYVSGASVYGSAVYMYASGGSLDDAGYLRFDLGSLNVTAVLDAQLVLRNSGGAPRNDAINTGRFALYGLSNVAGNTPQNWDESTLSESGTNPVGAEWTGTVPLVLTGGRLTNLDADDGVAVTESIVQADGTNYWDPGAYTITISGQALIDFLQDRAEDEGLATFIIANDDGSNRGYGIATKENTTEEFRPALILTYISGGAIDPVPQNGSTLNKDGLTQLSWTLTENVATCRVYFGTEPNLLTMDSIYFNPAVESVNIDSFPSFSTPLAEGAYHWRVACWDQYYADPNGSEPNYLSGQFWSFTATSTPIIEQQTTPTEQALFEGDTAEFIIVVTSSTSVTYTWYRSSDNANDTPGDDVSVGTNSPTLTLTNLTRTDEGYYYCMVVNTAGSVVSDMAHLAVKRKVAHWTLDELVGGQYADISGEGHHADPNGVPVFVAGTNPSVTNNGVQIDTVNGYASAGTWNPSEHTGQLSVSLWAKWAGQTAPSTWQGLIAKENSFGATTMMWQLEVDMNNNNMALKSGTSNLTSIPLPVDTWVHITIVFNGTTATIYRNGVSSVSGAFTQGTKTDAPVLIGASSMDTVMGLFYSLFNGTLDDVQIYNYALTWNEVIDLYHDISGLSVCTNSPIYDLTGDCLTNLADFAVFASNWLDCGMYPECP
jgi:hypothetical protein